MRTGGQYHVSITVDAKWDVIRDCGPYTHSNPIASGIAKDVFEAEANARRAIHEDKEKRRKSSEYQAQTRHFKVKA